MAAWDLCEDSTSADHSRCCGKDNSPNGRISPVNLLQTGHL